MEKEQPRIRIELTEDQVKHIKEASGQSVSALEITVQELEARIAPTSLSYGQITWTYKPQS